MHSKRTKYRRLRGFTLIEALVAVVIVSVAIVSVFGGMRAMAAARTRASEAELLQQLALQKMNELGAVTDLNSADTKGDFSEQGHAEVSWTVDVEPSGVTNVNQVTVTATRNKSSQTFTGLLFVRPTTGSAGT